MSEETKMQSALKGYQFDRMRVTPENDALMYSSMMGGAVGRINYGHKNDLKVTGSGLNAIVDTGSAIIYGRLVEVVEPITITLPANASGYIVITVDLTQTNTSTGTPGGDDYTPINNQVRCEQVSSLVNQDLVNDGKIFTFPIASFKTNASTATVTAIDAAVFEPQFEKGFKDYHSTRKVRMYKIGNLVTVQGAISNEEVIAKSSSINMFKIPEEIIPKQSAVSIQQASGLELYVLEISKENKVATLSRHRNGGSYTDVDKNAWLQVNTSWIV